MVFLVLGQILKPTLTQVQSRLRQQCMVLLDGRIIIILTMALL